MEKSGSGDSWGSGQTMPTYIQGAKARDRAMSIDTASDVHANWCQGKYLGKGSKKLLLDSKSFLKLKHPIKLYKDEKQQSNFTLSYPQDKVMERLSKMSSSPQPVPCMPGKRHSPNGNSLSKSPMDMTPKRNAIPTTPRKSIADRVGSPALSGYPVRIFKSCKKIVEN